LQALCKLSVFDQRLNPVNLSTAAFPRSTYVYHVYSLFVSSVFRPLFRLPSHRPPAISHFNHQLTSATYIFYRLSFQMITYSLPPHLSSLNISIPLPRICFRVLTAMRYSTSNYAKSSNSIPHLAAHPVGELHTVHIIPALQSNNHRHSTRNTSRFPSRPLHQPAHLKQHTLIPRYLPRNINKLPALFAIYSLTYSARISNEQQNYVCTTIISGRH
jgi:hypothetical protein